MKKSKKALIWLAILGAWLIWSPSFSQNKENVKNNAKKELVNIYWKEISHDVIINMDIDDILKFYDNEKKWLEVIKKHILIELNNARNRKWNEKLQVDSLLTKSAQKHAEELAKNNLLEHENSKHQSVGDRAKSEGFNYTRIRSNIADWSDIKTVVSGFVRSTKGWHESIVADRERLVVGIWMAKYDQDIGKWCFVFDYAAPVISE